MNSLLARIVTAVLTFTIGVALAGLWLARPFTPVIEPISLKTPSSRLEMVFVLDTTGSMGGLIQGAQQRIWGIINEVMQQSTQPSVRVGLVAYRDRHDEYVTQVLPLTEDLDKVYTTLMGYMAQGGGDGPEDVRTALADGLNKVSWSPAADDLSQIIFLVGDAPPHNDYSNTVDTLTTAAYAVQKGIIVNTIQCGMEPETKRVWQAIAARGQGQYFAITENGGVQAITTPYDQQLGELANRLGATFLAYGFGDSEDAEARRAEVKRNAEMVEGRVMSAAPATAKAERAVNKVVSAKAYVGDLLQNIENGSVKLADVNPADLPEDLQSLSPSERQQEIEKRLAERREIRAQIVSLSTQRDSFIAAERKKSTGSKNAFDTVVGEALKVQMARKSRK